MKKIYFNIYIMMTGLLLVAVSFPSCKKLVTIPGPPSSITQQEQFADSVTTMSAVAGVYAYNTGTGFAYSDGSLTYLTGFSSDELSYTFTNDNQQFYSYNLTPLNTGITTLWTYAYQSVYQVNAVMNGIAGNNNLSAGFQKQITGEMDVVRALYYFNLVNLYGDVPLVTSTDYKITSRIPRTPIAAVYRQIMNDLADARKKLPAAYPSSGRARPNLYTATALLAKVNLYLGNWQNAYNEADSVIRLGNYSLTGLNKVFLDGSTEAIWQLPADQGFGRGVADAQLFVPYNNTVLPSYLVTPFLINAFEPGDQRRVNWIGLKNNVVSGVSQTLYYPYKYKNRATGTGTTEDQMVLRLAEIYLIRAEAAAQLNNLPQALADVNTIRVRAGLSVSTAASQADILSAVMHERQTELFCEWGNRWYDLKRTGKAAIVLGAEKTGYTANAALYPIPQAQIKLDNLLIQNPGY